VSLYRTVRSIYRVGVREWWRQMQYIGDAKSGRLVGADQCVEFHSGDAGLFRFWTTEGGIPPLQFQRTLWADLGLCYSGFVDSVPRARTMCMPESQYEFQTVISFLFSLMVS